MTSGVDNAFQILIAALGLLPGWPGNAIYEMLVGVNRREKDSRAFLRALLFSVIGLVVAILAFDAMGGTLPLAVLESQSGRQAQLLALAQLYLLQFLFAALAAVATAVTLRAARPFMPDAAVRESWDWFVQDDAKERWVVVSLESGRAYAGKLKGADVRVDEKDRDLRLAEPAQYRDGNYFSLPYSTMFIPARLVSSLAVVHDPADVRVTAVNQPLFSQEATRAETRPSAPLAETATDA